MNDLLTSLLSGDRAALARAITLIESTRPDHRAQAEALLDEIAETKRETKRFGISGVPGVGKSTLIEALGNYAIAQGEKVAVLAVDPSSSVSGGSILGDKTRMQTLAQSPDAFIRPTPSSLHLGGVGAHTREAIALVEAAGFTTILIETVGVGQSEIEVAEMVDMARDHRRRRIGLDADRGDLLADEVAGSQVRDFGAQPRDHFAHARRQFRLRNSERRHRVLDRPAHRASFVAWALSMPHGRGDR